MANDLKMCQSCRALIPANAPRCEMCGAEGHYAARASSEDGEAFGLFAHWPVTTLLLTANVVVYALMLLYQMRFATQAGESPGFSLTPDGRATLLFGSAYPGLRQTGDWWRLLASCFLHGGPIHLLFNSMALIQAGRLAEEIYGGAQFICLYVITGVTGMYVAIVFGANVVGASGALFGLIGALAVYGYRRTDTLGRSLRQDMMYWLLYGLAMSFFPGISMAAHVGGMVAGAALALVLPDQDHLRESYTRMRAAQIVSIIAWLLIIGTGITMARNITGQGDALQAWEDLERVDTVWQNHQRMDQLLEQANARLANPNASEQELPSLATLSKRLDQTQKALCSDPGALGRLTTKDEKAAQLYQRMSVLLRARCSKPVEVPNVTDEAVFKASITALQEQATQAQALEPVMQEYMQWIEGKTAKLRTLIQSRRKH